MLARIARYGLLAIALDTLLGAVLAALPKLLF